MNATLIGREVRRQAVASLALLGLGLFMIAGFALFATSLRWRGVEGYGLVPFLIAILGPYLLGVAAVAPDVESGGEAFLMRLPIRRLSLLVTRSLVAAGWAGVVVSAVTLLDTLFVAGRLPSDWPQLVGLGCGSLLAGLIASVTLRYTLLAFLCGPTLVGGPMLLYQWLLGSMSLEWRHGPTVGMPAFFLAVGALVATWCYLRPDLLGTGWRALKLTAAVYAAVVAASLGATRVAWAVACSVTREVGLEGAAERQDGALIAASRVQSYPRLGLERTNRPVEPGLLVVPGARPTELPPGNMLGFSPDGSRSLHVAYTADGSRFTIADSSGRTTSVSLPYLVSPTWGPTLFGERQSVGWADQVPWVVVTEGGRGTLLAEVAPGGRRLPLLGATPCGFARSHLLVHSTLLVDTKLGGIVIHRHQVLDLRRPEAGFQEPAPGLAGATEAILVGPALVGLKDGPAGARLEWVDLERRTTGSLPLPGLSPPAPAPAESSRGVDLWADGDAALVVHAYNLEPARGRTDQSSTWRVDLASGEAQDLQPRLEGYSPRLQVGPGWLCTIKPGPDRRPQWALVSTRLDPEPRRELSLDSSPLRLFSGERLLLADGWVVDARSGEPLSDLLAPLR